MATADEVVVEFRARTDRYKSELRSAAAAFERATNRQQSQMEVLEQRIRASGDGISRTFKGLAGSLAAAFSARQLQQFADNFTRLQNGLRVAGLEGEALKEVQDRLFASSQRYGVEINALADLYSKSAQAGQELGASQAELLKLTEATSQALLITGTSTVEASGAILGLSQALASGTVRAEEFNQVNEGGLRPLLQAAANAERFGGSVAKLRAAILDGKVSSEEFFRAILSGSAILEGQASKAALTLSAGFTTLSNALTVYFGEADKANGVSAALGEALKTLADNLDIIIPAIAVIATGLGIGFVVNAGRAAVAATGAATAMGGMALAARGAGAAMLGAFGGPVGVALTALTLGIGYLATNLETAEQKTERFKSETEEAAAKVDLFERRLRAAGIEVDSVGDKASSAADNVREFTGSMFDAISVMQRFIEQAKLLELAEMGAQRAQIASEKAKLERDQLRSVPLTGGGGYAGLGGDATGKVEQGRKRERAQQIKELEAQDALLVRQMELFVKGLENGVDVLSDVPSPGSSSAPSESSSSKPKPTPKTPTGPTAAEIEERYTADLARLNAEELQARLAITDDIDKRADLMRELLRAERDERVRQIELDADYSDEQKAAQIAVIDALYGRAKSVRDANGDIVIDAENGLYTRRVIEDLDEEIIRQKQSELGLQADVLDAQAQAERNISIRNGLEQRSLDIQHRIERSMLEQQIANKQIADAAKARALLEQRQAADREILRQQQESPFERYVSQLRDTQTNLTTALEGLGVDTLTTFNNSLVEAIVNFRSLGDVGRAALATLTEGLVRLAIQQLLVNTLAKQFGENSQQSGNVAESAAASVAGQLSEVIAQQLILKAVGSSLGKGAAETSVAEAATVAAAWAPAAASVALATLGNAAIPAAAALIGTHALSQGLSAAPGFAGGGRIYGPGSPTSDSVNIRASRDEFMMRASSAKSIGYPALEFMNRTGEIPDVSTAAPKAAGFSPSASLDRGFKAEIRDAVAEAARTMPAINLYPTLSPAAALDAALSDPGGQRRLFDFFGQNSGAINSRLSGR